jgi:hypothetical protein
MTSITRRVVAGAPLGERTALPKAGTWLENPYVYDDAAREIKALAQQGDLEVVDERIAAVGSEPLIAHIEFVRNR